MALVQYGGGILQIRGSIGGQTHSRNRYGNYIRAKTNPVNPQTARQNAVRNNLASLVARWQSVLTQVMRDAWKQYADNVAMDNVFGESVNLTGFNHFVRANCARLQAGLDPIDAGPTAYTLPDTDPDFDVSFTADDDKISVIFDDTKDWCDSSAAGMTIFAGIPQSSAIGYFGGPYRYCGVIQGSGSSPPTSPQELDVPYEMATGHKVFAKARIAESDGRLSTIFRDEAIVAAS